MAATGCVNHPQPLKGYCVVVVDGGKSLLDVTSCFGTLCAPFGFTIGVDEEERTSLLLLSVFDLGKKIFHYKNNYAYA